jgi:hypothetical protein
MAKVPQINNHFMSWQRPSGFLSRSSWILLLVLQKLFIIDSWLCPSKHSTKLFLQKQSDASKYFEKLIFNLILYLKDIKPR